MRKVAWIVVALVLFGAGCSDGPTGSGEGRADLGSNELEAPAPSDGVAGRDDVAADDSASPSALGSGDACALFAEIRDVDDEIGGRVNELMLAVERGELSFDEADAQMVAVFDDLAARWSDELAPLYTELAEVLPPDLADAALDLQYGTWRLISAMEGVQSMRSIEDAIFMEFGPEGLESTYRATLELDRYSRQTCGIVLAD